MEESLKLGLLNWFPMERGKTLLFVGTGDGFIQDFERRGICVIPGSSIENNKNDYDYIVAYCALEESEAPARLLAEFKDILKPTGHLFVVCQNRLSLRNFVGDKDPYTNQIFDGIDNYRNYASVDSNELRGRCYARYELEQLLHEAGFSSYRGYSVLPGLEMPQQIYAWDYLPEERLEIRYTPLYHNPFSVFLEEKFLYDSVINNGMFHQMANAYLIDCTIDGEFYEINHLTTSMDRGTGHAIATVIQEDGVVVKKALYPEANVQIRSLYRNMKNLKKSGIATIEHQELLAGTFDGQELSAVGMPYIKAPTALEYLRELAFADEKKFIAEMSRFLDTILLSSEAVEDSTGTIAELGPIYRNVYMDMVPINCFVIDGEFVFYDQEFCEKNYPIAVVLVRAIDIVYMGDRKLEDVVPSSFFFDQYHLTDKLNVFRTKSNLFIEKLRNRNLLTEFHAEHLADAAVIYENRQRMNFSAQEYNKLFVHLLDDADDKQTFIFGSGQWARKFVAEFGDVISIRAMLDNQEANHGKLVDGIPVMSPDVLLDLNPEEYKVCVCVKYYTSILIQLEKLGCKHVGIYDPNLDRPTTFRPMAQEAGQDLILESSSKPYHIGYVAGVFDLFHIGHLNLLKRAKEQCDYLMVGVVSDEQAKAGKDCAPYVGEEERKALVEACKYVDEAFILPIYASGTRDVYRKYHFDVQFSGSDYEHNPSWLREQAWLRERGADLVFFPYTESTSSTKLKTAIEKDTKEKKQ